MTATDGGATRSQRHQAVLAVSPERAFGMLVTPSAIRAWWGAARAVVVAKPGGVWAAAWGVEEDAPDYVTAATIEVYEPPRRLALGDFRYAAKSGPLPFEADLRTVFTLSPAAPGGSLLEVLQTGFPADAAADDFFAACERGWRETLASLARHACAAGPR